MAEPKKALIEAKIKKLTDPLVGKTYYILPDSPVLQSAQNPLLE
jgi:hypothetical protein